MIESGIELSQGDYVSPGLTTPLEGKSFDVYVFKSKPVVIDDDGKVTKTFSAFESIDNILNQLNIAVHPSDRVSIERINDVIGAAAVGQKITIRRATPVKVHLDGRVVEPRTFTKTVSELVTEMKLSLAPEDRTEPDLSASIEPDMNIQVIRVNRQIETRREAVNFATETRKDDTLEQGYKEVIQEGRLGYKDVTYTVRYENGTEVDRIHLKESKISDPVNNIVVVGTKLVEDAWYKLRMCESGNNYNRNSGNGFYGAYQFDLSTWRSNGGTGMPHEAAPGLQDEIARRLQARRGWKPWPMCRIKLGLP